MKCPSCQRPMKILISYPTNLYHCEYNDCSLATPIPFSSCTNKKEARRLTNKLDQPTFLKRMKKVILKKWYLNNLKFLMT